jgi:Cu/Ag efflux pump CusA
MFTTIFISTAVSIFLALLIVPEVRMFRVSQRRIREGQEQLNQRAKRWSSLD